VVSVDTYEVSTAAPPRSVMDWYAAFYEHHAEKEQIARAEGDEKNEKKHHEAVLRLIRAITAEQVPT
jgi:hypothetical protein